LINLHAKRQPKPRQGLFELTYRLFSQVLRLKELLLALLDQLADIVNVGTPESIDRSVGNLQLFDFG
jgi:hypothetical protein